MMSMPDCKVIYVIESDQPIVKSRYFLYVVESKKRIYR